MTTAALLMIGATTAVIGYAYVVYPLVLLALAARRTRRNRWSEPARWPSLTITLPVHNEEAVIRAKLDSLLVLDYPAALRHILVISDASTDRTDEIVAEYADRGVELLRLPVRRGKSAAENAAAARLRGEIVVSTDAAARFPSESLRALVRAFQDPTVGAASGRSAVVRGAREDASSEDGYIGYEMWVRGLETRIDSIVGASGAFYAVRRNLYDGDLPEEVARDFAVALRVKERGYRAVSVSGAICYWSPARSLRIELRRKVRTMTHGLNTLWHFRHLMNPLRYGRFALMLASHKLCRWAVFPLLPLALLGIILLSPVSTVAAALFGASAVGLAFGALAITWSDSRPLPRVIVLCGWIVVSAVAGLLAWRNALRREGVAIWEPTKRHPVIP